MSRKRLTIVALVLIAGAVGAFFAFRDDSGETSGSDDQAVVVVARPERRTLRDQVTVRGEIRRDELQRITSPIDGQVSAVAVDDGDTVEPGDTIIALDGRAAVAVNGSFSFFRPLDVGSDGPDVLQLEEILSADGYEVGTVDSLFTEETRAGLARWQIDRGYGGATPEPDEVITATLAQGTGYSIGARSSVSVTVGPSVPALSGGPRGRSVGPSPSPEPRPKISVRATTPRVREGETAVVTFTSDIVMPTSTTIDYTVGGDLTADDDYEALDGSFTFRRGETSFALEIDILEDDELEVAEELVITVGADILPDENPNWEVGPLSEARVVVIADRGQPTMRLSANETVVDEGGALTVTVESDVVRNEDTVVDLVIGGGATEGADYDEIDREITLPAGADSVAVTIATNNDDLVEHDEFVIVTLVTDGEDYRLEPPDSITLRIESEDVPEVTLTGGGIIPEGESASFTIVADQPFVEDTSVNYQVGGTAQGGADFRALTGTVVIPAGSREWSVTVQTLDDDVVFRPLDMIVADWPARVGSVAVDEGEVVLLGQLVLTLTEPDFTINMILTPTDRSKLDVGQIVEVELEASDQRVEGTITELDDNATIDAAGAETYLGVVDVVDSIDAVDGAAVNIEVTLDERIDALVVPVASVLQDGSGNDVVRVVDADGNIVQQPIVVGLSEGSFIEVVEGLVGDETLVIEVT